MTVLDGPVKPGRGTYSEREQPCGCRGVPEGQHVATKCGDYPSTTRGVAVARECLHCGYRSKTEHGRCAFCGEEKWD